MRNGLFGRGGKERGQRGWDFGDGNRYKVDAPSVSFSL
jgi:hypothetical protein